MQELLNGARDFNNVVHTTRVIDLVVVVVDCRCD